MNIIYSIKKLFGLTEDQVRNHRREMAESIVRLKYYDKKPYVIIDGVPLFEITNESVLRNGTIALADVPGFMETIKDRYAEKE